MKIDFMPNWKKEEECFKDEPFFRTATDMATGKKKTIKGNSRQKPVLQCAYELGVCVCSFEIFLGINCLPTPLQNQFILDLFMDFII